MIRVLLAEDQAMVRGALAALLSAACALQAGPAGQPSPTAAPSSAGYETEDEPQRQTGVPTITPRPLPTSAIAGVKTEVVVDGVLFPSSLSVAPDGRIFFLEVKKGEMRVVVDKRLQPAPVLSVAVPRGGEHGLIGLVKTLALEGASDGISACAVCPGYVRTPLVESQVAAQAQAHGMPEERVLEEVILAPHAVKRLIEPEEVAETVAFLLGPAGAAFSSVS